MYKLNGTNWVDRDGNRVSAQKVSDYLERLALRGSQTVSTPRRHWNWLSFIAGVIVTLVLDAVGFNWLGGVVDFAWEGMKVLLSILLALAILVGILWIARQVGRAAANRPTRPNNQEPASAGSDQNRTESTLRRLGVGFNHRGGES